VENCINNRYKFLNNSHSANRCNRWREKQRERIYQRYDSKICVSSIYLNGLVVMLYWAFYLHVFDTRGNRNSSTDNTTILFDTSDRHKKT